MDKSQGGPDCQAGVRGPCLSHGAAALYAQTAVREKIDEVQLPSSRFVNFMLHACVVDKCRGSEPLKGLKGNPYHRLFLSKIKLEIDQG